MSDEEALRVARERVGRVLLGKYRLDRVLGVGGMASVYLADHRNNKQFAVKMLHPEISMRENIRTRFLRVISSRTREAVPSPESRATPSWRPCTTLVV